MYADIPNLVRRPGWGLESVIDPAYAKLGERLSTPEELPPGGFAYFGVPFEGLLFGPVGGKGGPDGLRAALARLRPYSIDLDIDFVESNGMADLGDVEVEQMSYEATLSRTESVTRAVLQRGWTPMVAGGSHTITEATLRAFSEHHGKRVGVIWIDAHPDLMDNYKGDRHYCGCPLRRNIDTGHMRPENVALLGLRGFANAPGEIREWRERGVTFYTMENIYEKGIDRCIDEAIEIATRDTDAFYLTFDTDGLDHTFAPGTQYPAPGGFQAFEAMRLVRRVALAGAGAMDVVEYAPVLDPQRNTGNLLATVMAEFMAGSARRQLDAGTA